MILYPLWILRVEVRPRIGGTWREALFSVDGVRGIPLPIRSWPETTPQEIPLGCRILDAAPLEVVTETTLHFARKGLGFPGSFGALARLTESLQAYKIYWVVDEGDGEGLVDSRSGARVRLAEAPPA